MKKIIFILLSTIIFAQQKNSTYTYTVEYETKPIASVDYTFNTQLIIVPGKSQYHYLTKDKNVEKNGMTFKFKYHEYFNQYDFKSNILSEKRIYKNSKSKSSRWKQDYNWVITNETSKIHGYHVIKAEANSIELSKNDPYYFGKVYAWYSPDIMLPTGPGRYAGLPGLILRIEYEKAGQKINLISIKKTNTNTKLNYIKGDIEVENPKEIILY